MVFDPLSWLIIAAIGSAAVCATVFFAYLTWSILVNWFQEYETLATRSTNVAATIKTKLASGDHAVVQGIFNKNTGETVKGRIIKYDKLDSQVRDAHRNSEVVIWQ
ncbi:MAG TPA: hypothetical protein DCY88_28495 [Cyanobacteria bacterium UBA11372]|nr:hypothetical protein [Cyanobacteria bacterium UBA11372]